MRTEQPRILVLGASGRTGRRVVEQALDAGRRVRAVVRSAGRIPEALRGRGGLEVVERGVLELTDAEWDRHLEGCGAVVSCLGHVIGVRGIWGPPWRLCTRAAREAASAIERRGEPTRLILMNTVGVPAPSDPARSFGERALLAALRVAVPPHADNIAAAAFVRSLGEHPSVRWCVVRPDALTEDEPVEPAVSASPPGPLFPGMKSSRATVAAFMVRLVTDDDAWEAWHQRSPVVVDSQDDQALEEA